MQEITLFAAQLHCYNFHLFYGQTFNLHYYKYFIQIAADESPPEGCTLFFVVHGEKTCEFDSLGKLLQAASDRYLLNFLLLDELLTFNPLDLLL